ncbi:MAG: hypothetical protein PHX87_00155 [Candidatus Peribacteraceae bacterium]|nr:hypothetical protein [Candidatus Peribacteraceae bacterium]MDD5741820.1 hypothetical protein [Candidatus Peribacteraceae bacterium]
MIHNQLFAAKRWRASTGPAAARPAEPFGRGAQPLKGLPAVAKRAKAEGLSLMNRPGYIFLLSVIMVGAIAVATLSSLLMIGVGSMQIGFTVRQSEQARSLSQTCVERALRSLWEDTAYAGNEEFTFDEGVCDILRIGGSGNENRSVCAEGRVGPTVRRYEILLDRVLPSIQVATWREVDQFTVCSYQ